MTVVTIRGQMGSGAPEIGKLIAGKLHADYVDREIIAGVAATLKERHESIVDKEMPPGSLLGRIVEALGRGYTVGGVYPGAYVPTWEIPLDDTRYLEGLQSVIRDLARTEAIVIRGRGSQFILKDYPGTFHILVVAPLELRVKRVMEGLKVDEESAKKEITRFDSSRGEFIKRYFQAQLEDPAHYDLVINTEHLDFEAAASIVIGAIPLKERTMSVSPAA